jgi:hypothetical protein
MKIPGAKIPDLDVPISHCQAPIRGYVQDVYEELCKLETRRAPAPDGIANIETVSSALSIPLHILFTKSLDAAPLPQDWKDGDVIPLYKGGDSFECCNFRPVTYTSCVVIVLEHLIVKSFMQHVE